MIFMVAIVVVDPNDLASLYEHRRVAWIQQAANYGARVDAEDVVQEVMLTILEGTEPAEDEPLDGDDPTKGLIPRLIRVFSYRWRARRSRYDLRHVSLEDLSQAVHRLPIETCVDVQRAVESLVGPDIPSWLIWGGLATGETCRELALRLKIHYSTVSRRLAWAKTQLGELLHSYRGDRKPRLGVL